MPSLARKSMTFLRDVYALAAHPDSSQPPPPPPPPVPHISYQNSSYPTTYFQPPQPKWQADPVAQSGQPQLSLSTSTVPQLPPIPLSTPLQPFTNNQPVSPPVAPAPSYGFPLPPLTPPQQNQSTTWKPPLPARPSVPTISSLPAEPPKWKPPLPARKSLSSSVPQRPPLQVQPQHDSLVVNPPVSPLGSPVNDLSHPSHSPPPTSSYFADDSPPPPKLHTSSPEQPFPGKSSADQPPDERTSLPIQALSSLAQAVGPVKDNILPSPTTAPSSLVELPAGGLLSSASTLPEPNNHLPRRTAHVTNTSNLYGNNHALPAGVVELLDSSTVPPAELSVNQPLHVSRSPQNEPFRLHGINSSISCSSPKQPAPTPQPNFYDSQGPWPYMPPQQSFNTPDPDQQPDELPSALHQAISVSMRESTADSSTIVPDRSTLIIPLPHPSANRSNDSTKPNLAPLSSSLDISIPTSPPHKPSHHGPIQRPSLSPEFLPYPVQETMPQYFPPAQPQHN